MDKQTELATDRHDDTSSKKALSDTNCTENVCTYYNREAAWHIIAVQKSIYVFKLSFIKRLE